MLLLLASVLGLPLVTPPLALESTGPQESEDDPSLDPPLAEALVLGFKSVFGDKVHAEVTLGAEAIREPEFAIWRVTDVRVPADSHIFKAQWLSSVGSELARWLCVVALGPEPGDLEGSPLLPWARPLAWGDETRLTLLPTVSLLASRGHAGAADDGANEERVAFGDLADVNLHGAMKESTLQRGWRPSPVSPQDACCGKAHADSMVSLSALAAWDAAFLPDCGGSACVADVFVPVSWFGRHLARDDAAHIDADDIEAALKQLSHRAVFESTKTDDLGGPVFHRNSLRNDVLGNLLDGSLERSLRPPPFLRAPLEALAASDGVSYALDHVSVVPGDSQSGKVAVGRVPRQAALAGIEVELRGAPGTGRAKAGRTVHVDANGRVDGQRVRWKYTDEDDAPLLPTPGMYAVQEDQQGEKGALEIACDVPAGVDLRDTLDADSIAWNAVPKSEWGPRTAFLAFEGYEPPTYVRRRPRSGEPTACGWEYGQALGVAVLHADAQLEPLLVEHRETLASPHHPYDLVAEIDAASAANTPLPLDLHGGGFAAIVIKGETHCNVEFATTPLDLSTPRAREAYRRMQEAIMDAWSEAAEPTDAAAFGFEAKPGYVPHRKPKLQPGAPLRELLENLARSAAPHLPGAPDLGGGGGGDLESSFLGSSDTEGSDLEVRFADDVSEQEVKPPPAGRSAGGRRRRRSPELRPAGPGFTVHAMRQHLDARLAPHPDGAPSAVEFQFNLGMPLGVYDPLKYAAVLGAGAALPVLNTPPDEVKQLQSAAREIADPNVRALVAMFREAAATSEVAARLGGLFKNYYDVLPKHNFGRSPAESSNAEAADAYPAFRAALLWYRHLFGEDAPRDAFNVRGTSATTAPFTTEAHGELMHVLLEFRSKTGRHDDSERGWRRDRERLSPAMFMLDKREELLRTASE